MAARSLEKQVRGQLSALTVMFLVGMALTFVGLPSELSGGSKVVSVILLVLHVLIGIGLVIGVFLVLRLSAKADSRARTLARWGGVAIGLTFVFGVVTIATENDWWSYAMAVGFIASFLLYGTLLLNAKTSGK